MDPSSDKRMQMSSDLRICHCDKNKGVINNPKTSNNASD